jgi:hypothetical protein
LRTNLASRFDDTFEGHTQTIARRWGQAVIGLIRWGSAGSGRINVEKPRTGEQLFFLNGTLEAPLHQNFLHHRQCVAGAIVHLHHDLTN